MAFSLIYRENEKFTESTRFVYHSTAFGVGTEYEIHANKQTRWRCVRYLDYVYALKLKKFCTCTRVSESLFFSKLHERTEELIIWQECNKWKHLGNFTG